MPRKLPPINYRLSQSRITTVRAGVLLLVIAVAARTVAFSNPVANGDEQFYLLMGNRFLHGAIPYVDIWDRKPLGLIILYAIFRLPGGNGIIASHATALLSVTATSLLLFLMARRIARPRAALTTAAIYILSLNLAGGEAAQVQIFYNLLITAAVALVMFHGTKAATKHGNMRGTGLAAMLLVGIALQLKYSVVFEGLFVGLLMLAMSCRAGRPKADLSLDCIIWVFAAVLPTGLAAAWYVFIGHFPEWFFANVTSIALRGPELAHTSETRLFILACLVVPLWAAIPLRVWLAAPAIDLDRARDRRLVDCWSASAILGVILFGTWFSHYALPLFAPLSVSAAPLGSSRIGRAYLAMLLVVGGTLGQYVSYEHAANHGAARDMAEAVAATKGASGCIFVYDGYPALYDATGSCLPTTHPFPAHLHSLNERRATGIDPIKELRRIMAARPERVVTLEPGYREENPAARAEVYRVLRRSYVETYRSRGLPRALVVFRPLPSAP